MTLNEAREAIYQLFIAAWGSTTPLDVDNEEFTEPAGDTAWIRFVVRHTGSAPETFGAAGARRFSRKGSVFVQVFTPVDRGVAGADTLAQLVRDTLEGINLSGIWLFATIVREIGREEAWYHMEVETPFEYEEIK